MAAFDDRDDESLRLIDIIRPRPKEPQEEYAIPFRVRNLKNRMEVYQRQQDDVSQELSKLVEERERAEIRLNYINDQILNKLAFQDNVERKLRAANQELRIESVNL
jgi:hypothetical protein